MMTPTERKVKSDLITILNEEGYPRYSLMLKNFDVKLITDEDVVAYIAFEEGRIVVNAKLYLDEISTVVRHELLHHFLAHHPRMKKKIVDELGYDINNLTEEEEREVYEIIYGDPNQTFNIAADYEISNRGYTPKDKRILRRLHLGDRTVQGLVTDDDHPDWVNDSMEQMYDKLRKEQEQNKTIFVKGNLLDEYTFVDEDGNPVDPIKLVEED